MLVYLNIERSHRLFFESFRPGFVNEQRSTPNGTHPTSPRSPIIDLKVNN